MTYWKGFDRIRVIASITIGITLALAACTSPEPTPVPTETPSRVTGLVPMATPSPTDTPKSPTNTPVKRITPPPSPTETPPSTPTQTPRPTNTPRPTSTPRTPSPIADLGQGEWLEQNQPAQANEITGLSWVADGVDDTEREAAESLIAMARWHRTTFSAALEKSWVGDGVTPEETNAIKWTRWLAKGAPELADQMLEIEWLQDEITAEESRAVEYLRWTAEEAPELAEQMLGVAWIEDGIVADEAQVITDIARTTHDARLVAERMVGMSWLQDEITAEESQAVKYLRLAAREAPQQAERMVEMSWLQDEITEEESRAVQHLRGIAKETPALAERILENSWARDDITRDESKMILYVLWMTKDHSEFVQSRIFAATAALLDMPFLDSVESADAMAMWDLSRIARLNARAFLNIVASSKVSDGLTDQEAKVVAVLSSAYRFKPDSLPILLDGLDGTGSVYLEERSVDLTYSGKVHLTIIRVQDQVTASMDYLESVVRNVEEFMEEPLPTNYVALYFDDATVAGGGRHADTHITSELRHDDVSDPYWQDTPKRIAHEVGHYYWKGSNKWWLSDGAADFLSFISENARIGRPLEPDRRPCPYFDNISQLERAKLDPPSPKNECNYSLGQRLYLDLYRTLGDTEFRRGFQNLYLKYLEDDRTDGCDGTKLEICHLAAAFKDGAPDNVAAKVDEIVARWYGPLP